MTARADALRRAAHGVVMPNFTGITPPPWLLRAADEGLAAVLLFGHNTPDPQTTAELTGELRRRAPDLLVSSDEEGGDVTRVQHATGSVLPGAGALGSADDVELTRRCAHAQGQLMRAAGIDLPITPVLDVASRADNPVIGVRSFGADPELVARHGVATVQGLRAAGVASCAKHFPGHGDTNVDSHVGLPVLDVSQQVLRERDLPPFAAAIEAGLDTLMTGHLHVPSIGPAPASQEPAAAALARSLGLRGPIITDALDMGALHDDPDAGPGTSPAASMAEASVRALVGGADLLCLGPAAGRDDEGLFTTVVEAIVTAVDQGRLEAGALLASADRNRALAVDLRRRQQGLPAPDLAPALTTLEQVGAEAAAAAVATTGRVDLGPGDGLVDLRAGINLAAGSRVRAVPDQLTEHLGLVAVAPEDLTSWQAANPRRRLALLTRGTRDAVGPALAQAPEAVVIHLGVSGSAAAAPNLVLAFGSGLANAREIAHRCAR